MGGVVTTAQATQKHTHNQTAGYHAFYYLHGLAVVLALVHGILECLCNHGIDIACFGGQALAQQRTDLATGGRRTVERRGGVVGRLLVQTDLGTQCGDIVATICFGDEVRIDTAL